MKREIKFRGKRIDSDEWVFGYGAMYHAGFALILDAPGGVKVEPESIGQWTGLRDKNGVEIFEGDVLQLHEYGEVYKEVLFKNGCFCVHGFYWNKQNCEVVGNVFENADLIEGK